MENPEKSQYEVIITDPAEISFYEVLAYLYAHYELDRAEEISNELRDAANSLHYQPERGTLESNLQNRKQDYRYIFVSTHAKSRDQNHLLHSRSQ